MRLAGILVLVIAVHSYGQDPQKNVYSESAWADRDAWQNPQSIIKLLFLNPGSRVADVGCHEGYMTVKLSTAVGQNGKVYAVDLDQDRLNKLKEHLNARKLTNVTLIKGGTDDPLLPVGEFDAVLIMDTYHEMKEHEKILSHVWSALKPGGRLVICEPIADERRDLAREDQERKHELGISFVIDDLKKAGFQITYQRDPFIDRMKIKGDKLWIVVARKK